jgi:multiple sugar transport system substrate-binding protein
VNPNSVYDATIYDDTMIDLRDVFEECEHRYGKPVDLAIKTTYNPVTGRFYNFAPYYIAYSATYRKDLWDAAEKFPDTWEDLRLGGRKVKFYDGPGLGIGLGDDPDGRRMLGAMLFSFGGSIQDADNRPVLKSRQTLESLKFFKTLYEEAMSDEVLNWNDPIVNNRAMLAEEISWTLNGVSITRSAENLKLPVVDKLALARPPQGPERRLSPSAIYYPLAIWKFADNIEGAKQFLVDLAGSAREVFLASQFFYFPAYPQTIPDIAQLLAEDANAQPPDKYRLLADAADWATYESYPGYANGAFWEVGGSFLLNKMLPTLPPAR